MRDSDRLRTGGARMIGRLTLALAVINVGLMLVPKADAAPLHANLHSYAVPGSAFFPSNSDGQYGSTNEGCFFRIGGSPQFTYHLGLPDGVRIEHFQLEYADFDPALNILVRLLAYDGSNPGSVIASVGSTNDSGFGVAQTELDYVFDAASTSLQLELVSISDTDQLRACAVRILYQLPDIFADGFESGTTSAWSSTSP